MFMIWQVYQLNELLNDDNILIFILCFYWLIINDQQKAFILVMDFVMEGCLMKVLVFLCLFWGELYRIVIIQLIIRMI